MIMIRPDRVIYKQIDKMVYLKIFSLALFFAFFNSSVNAQKLTRNNNMDKILNDYIAIKNALADNEGTAAKLKANELYSLLTSQPGKGLNHHQLNVFANYLGPLTDNTRSIAITVIADEQRPYFAKLSVTLYELLKELKINIITLYEQYSPANNLYWLSEKRAIRNPYYESRDMASNGKIAAILAPVKKK
jgi:hypothetical protein